MRLRLALEFSLGGETQPRNGVFAMSKDWATKATGASREQIAENQRAQAAMLQEANLRQEQGPSSGIASRKRSGATAHC